VRAARRYQWPTGDQSGEQRPGLTTG